MRLGLGLNSAFDSSALSLSFDIQSYKSAYDLAAITPLDTNQLSILNTAFSTRWVSDISWEDYKSKIAGLWLAPATAGDIGPIAVPFKGFSGMVSVGFLTTDVNAIGVKGGTGKYLNLKFNPFTGLTDPNQAGFGWFNSSTLSGTTGIEFGGFRNGTDAIFSGYSTLSGASSWALHGLANRSILPSMLNRGARYCVRSSASLMTIYNGTAIAGTNTLAPGTPPNVDMIGFGRNQNTTGIPTDVSLNQAFVHPLMSLYVTDGALNQLEWLSFNVMLRYIYRSRGGVLPITLAFDGDSITVGQGVTTDERFSNKVAAVNGDSLLNYGVGAQTLVDMNSNVLAHLAERPFDCLVLFGGTNDMYYGATGATTYSRAVTLVQNIRASYPTLPIVFVNALPRSGNQTPADFMTQQASFNAALAADPANFPFLANVAVIPEMQDTTNLIYYQDGSHPTALGQTLLANTILPTVNLSLDR